MNLCSNGRLPTRVIGTGESSTVKVSDGPHAVRSDRYREASNLAGRSKQRTLQRRDLDPVGTDAGTLREPRLSMTGEGHDAGGRPGSACVPSGVRAAACKEGHSIQNREGLVVVQPHLISALGVKLVESDETGGSGRSSDDGRDSITRLERRARGRTRPSEGVRPRDWRMPGNPRLKAEPPH